jgi:hypothetical protein
MLDIDDATRARLRASGALVVDQDGEEVYAGLTLAESQFFVRWEKDPGVGHASAEAVLYLDLKHKHLVARSAGLLGDYAPAND